MGEISLAVRSDGTYDEDHGLLPDFSQDEARDSPELQHIPVVDCARKRKASDAEEEDAFLVDRAARQQHTTKRRKCTPTDDKIPLPGLHLTNNVSSVGDGKPTDGTGQAHYGNAIDASGHQVSQELPQESTQLVGSDDASDNLSGDEHDSDDDGDWMDGDGIWADEDDASGVVHQQVTQEPPLVWTQHPSFYPSLPLDPASDEFRLIRILPTHDAESPLRCALTIHPIRQAPTYEALSYVWGRSTQDCFIYVNGKAFPVTDNLGAALRRLRRREEARTIWIDALCIWQEGVFERNHQVSNMGRIYSQAEKVVVWLGDAEVPQSWDARLWRDCPPVASPEYIPWMERVWQTDTLWRAIKHAYPRWWTRVWTIQEVVLAKAVDVSFGAVTVSWDGLKRLLSPVVGRTDSPNFGDFALGLERIEALREAVRTKPPRLLDTLVMTKTCSATDERDRVYSILSLVDPAESALCSVDYSLPQGQVFAQAACVAANTSNDFSVLISLKCGQWGSQLNYQYLDRYLEQEAGKLFEHLRGLRFASEGAFREKQNIRITLGPTSMALSTTGYCLGLVRKWASFDCFDIADDVWEGGSCAGQKRSIHAMRSLGDTLHRGRGFLRGTHKALDSILDHAYALEHQLASFDDEGMLFYSVPAGIHDVSTDSTTTRVDCFPIHKSGADLTPSYLSCLLNQLGQPGEGKDTYLSIRTLAAWMRYGNRVDKSISLFTTSGGLLGLVPGSLIPSDVVALLPGPTTAILRPIDDGTYQFRGLAYVPSIVHIPASELEKREFVMT